ncbi:MAG: CPBP family intramembrane glutamic endopeptidase [Methyloglobulus sp.]|nr:CPBP family intramembrane metalloprotease [Methyloglobulus sp.]
MTKALLFPALLEILYLGFSFALAQAYGQWSYEGELSRTVLRLLSIFGFIYFYRKYCYDAKQSLKPKQKFAPPFILAITLFILFAALYTNAEHETLTWQLVFGLSGITAGFREELFYRGIVQNSLQKNMHYQKALLITCTLFTLSHIQFIYYGQASAVMLITLAGIIFGSIFIYTGSVLFVGAIHGLYDAVLCLNFSPIRLSNQAALPILLLITLLFFIIISKKPESVTQSDRIDPDNNDSLTTQ